MADLKVENETLKKKRRLGLSGDLSNERFDKNTKLVLVKMIDNSRLLVKDACELLKRSPQGNYRWKSRYEKEGISGLEDKESGPNLPYNKILPEEREAILEAADKYTDLKHRKLVPKLADEYSVSVSVSHLLLALT